MLTEFDKGTGAIQDKPDKRDFKYSEIAGAAAPFDWNAGYDIESLLGVILPVKDQGMSYSCGGQAWASYGNALDVAQGNPLKDKSAHFIYGQTHVQGGGSAARTNCDLVKNQGWGHESVVPSYQNGQPPSEAFMEDTSLITDIARLDATGEKAMAYTSIGTDIESMAQAIRDNHGIVIGLTGANNGTWHSAIPLPPSSTDGIWDHWVYAGKAKMINGKRAIGILNSWGVGIGQNGWQWLTEDYIGAYTGGRQNVWSAWNIIVNPNKPNPQYQHAFNTDINYGDSGPEVVALQTALQVNGQYPAGLPITGNYLDITRQAVLDFQNRYVSPDGIYQSIMVWFNNGRHASSLTRTKLNLLFAPRQ